MVTIKRKEVSEGDERRGDDRPIFSAFEIGKATTTRYELQRLTGHPGLVEDTTSVEKVYELYHANKKLDYLAIVDGRGSIVGYLRRAMFLAALSQSHYSRELLMRPERTVSELMDPRVITVDAFMSLSEASRLLMDREESIRFDPFVVSLEGDFLGLSTVKRVMDSMNHYVQRDLNACREAQDSMMMPLDTGVENKIHYSLFVEPLAGPGGDYADVFEINENLSVLTLFDVCGKGIKASNMVMAIGSMFRMMFDIENPETLDLKSLNMNARLERFNRLLWDMTPGEMYATGLVMVVDKQKLLLQVYDYGHGFLWLRRNGKVHFLNESNKQDLELPFLGITPELSLLPANYRMKPGDVVFTTSDGIPEQKNPRKEEFGLDPIPSIMMKTRDPLSLIDLMQEEVARFQEGYRRTDDFSALAFTI